MIELPNYKKATNAAYEILKNYDYEFPRIEIEYIIALYFFQSVRMCSYSNAASKKGMTHNEFTYNFASSEHGFTIANYPKNTFIIFYNDWKENRTIRFTLAHELGHIVLKHKEDNETTNREANCFARNLLCPAPIAEGLNLLTPKDYMDYFDVSFPMANISVEYHKSDLYNISKDLCNCFDRKICYYMTGYYSLEDMYRYY